MRGSDDELERGGSTFPYDVERFAERLNEVVNKESLRTFARRSGLSEGTLRKYLAGESTPNVERLIGIARAASVHIGWLAAGVGEKYVTEKARDPAAGSGGWLWGSLEAEGAANETGSEFALIPRYSVEARAGHGAAVEHEQVVGRFAFRRDWLSGAGLREKDLALITARGDSMEPTISDGDVLLIDTGVNQVDEDGVYAVRLNGHLAVKRLQRVGAGRVRVISDNSAYATYDIDLSDEEALDPDRLMIVGRVVWSGGLL